MDSKRKKIISMISTQFQAVEMLPNNTVLYLERWIGGHKGTIMTFDFSVNNHIPSFEPRARTKRMSVDLTSDTFLLAV